MTYLIGLKTTIKVFKSVIKEQRFLYNVAINQVKGKHGYKDEIIISGNQVIGIIKPESLTRRKSRF